jgi:Pheromone A receptor
MEFDTLFVVYIVQSHRYTIFEDVGCRITVLKTTLSAVLVPALRLAPCLVSGVYGCKENLPCSPARFDWIILRLEYVSH